MVNVIECMPETEAQGALYLYSVGSPRKHTYEMVDWRVYLGRLGYQFYQFEGLD